MKSNSEHKKLSRSIKKHIRREKAKLRKQLKGQELEKAVEELLARVRHG